MKVPSTNGIKYIMYFIDDYTRMCWVYFLKEKSQSFETFKNFDVWIQNEARSHIGCLHTNNGREYTSNKF
jgi:transposase InsO family protein